MYNLLAEIKYYSREEKKSTYKYASLFVKTNIMFSFTYWRNVELMLINPVKKPFLGNRLIIKELYVFFFFNITVR